MALVTEIAIVKVRDYVGNLDGAGEAASIWQHTIDTILAQNGATCLYWGRSVEDPSILGMFIEWESLDHHKRFEASEAYKPVLEKVMAIFSEITLVAHAQLRSPTQSAREVFTLPATELLSVFFPAEYTAA